MSVVENIIAVACALFQWNAAFEWVRNFRVPYYMEYGSTKNALGALLQYSCSCSLLYLPRLIYASLRIRAVGRLYGSKI